MLRFHNQQMYNLHFLRHGNFTFIALLRTVRGHFDCTYNLNKNSNLYKQNLSPTVIRFSILHLTFHSKVNCL